MTQTFWKYASTLKGISSIEDAFETWANKQAHSTEELQDIWSAIQLDVNTSFNKTAAITISGEPEELQQMFGKGEGATGPMRIDAPKIESPLKQIPGAPKPGGPIGGLPGVVPAGAGASPMPPMGGEGAPAANAPAPSNEGSLIDDLATE